MIWAPQHKHFSPKSKLFFHEQLKSHDEQPNLDDIEEATSLMKDLIPFLFGSSKVSDDRTAILDELSTYTAYLLCYMVISTQDRQFARSYQKIFYHFSLA